jgi:hypothetical protein
MLAKEEENEERERERERGEREREREKLWGRRKKLIIKWIWPIKSFAFN